MSSRKLCAFDHIWVGNGAEFVGRLVDLWAYANCVTMDFARPGKPKDNAFIESFNGSIRDEYLNVHWFDDLMDSEKSCKLGGEGTKRAGVTGFSMNSRP